MLSPKPVHHDKPVRHDKPAHHNMRRVLCASAASLVLCCSSPGRAHDGDRDNDRADTQTPIKHVVIIIPENRTFDNYFGTYPHAANIPGEQSWLGVPAPKFVAKRNTPPVNGLTPALLQNNPNRSLIGGPANPTRLRPADAYTCDMAHNYEPAQQAYDGGKVDRFPQTASGSGQGCAVDGSTVMNYYDGNTVQALWNYAQHFAISDNHFSTNYGPTVPGHANVISGNTHGVIIHDPANPAHPNTAGFYVNPADGSVTLTDANLPGYLDDCGKGRTFEFTGKNVGDLLNEKKVTWGYFQGGFLPTKPATIDAQGNLISPAVCSSQHVAHQMEINGVTYSVQNPSITPGPDVHVLENDYSTGVTPFMKFASTRNIQRRSEREQLPEAGLSSDVDALDQYPCFVSDISRRTTPPDLRWMVLGITRSKSRGAASKGDSVRLRSRPAFSRRPVWPRHSRASTTGFRSYVPLAAAGSDIPSPACRRRSARCGSATANARRDGRPSLPFRGTAHADRRRPARNR
jgi:hypothetical protein